MQPVLRHTLTPVPSLDELVSAPERVRELPAHTAKDLLAQLVSLQALLLAQCFASTVQPSAPSAASSTSSDRYLSIPDVARDLSVKSSYVYELARTGKLRAVRMGKYVRVSAGELARYKATLSHA